MSICIAPGHLESDYPNGASDEDRIHLFFCRMNGWLLDIAEQCINGGAQAIPHSGFAVLAMVFSYFEFIAKCYDGYEGMDQSGKFFKKGVYLVFPHLKGSSDGDVLVELLWRGARNGLYHSCIAAPFIAISSEFPSPLQLATFRGRTIAGINPHGLVPALAAHFQRYQEECCVVRDPGLRANLLKRLDYQQSESDKVQRKAETRLQTGT